MSGDSGAAEPMYSNKVCITSRAARCPLLPFGDVEVQRLVSDSSSRTSSKLTENYSAKADRGPAGQFGPQCIGKPPFGGKSRRTAALLIRLRQDRAHSGYLAFPRPVIPQDCTITNWNSAKRPLVASPCRPEVAIRERCAEGAPHHRSTGATHGGLAVCPTQRPRH